MQQRLSIAGHREEEVRAQGRPVGQPSHSLFQTPQKATPPNYSLPQSLLSTPPPVGQPRAWSVGASASLPLSYRSFTSSLTRPRSPNPHYSDHSLRCSYPCDSLHPLYSRYPR